MIWLSSRLQDCVLGKSAACGVNKISFDPNKSGGDDVTDWLWKWHMLRFSLMNNASILWWIKYVRVGTGPELYPQCIHVICCIWLLPIYFICYEDLTFCSQCLFFSCHAILTFIREASQWHPIYWDVHFLSVQRRGTNRVTTISGSCHLYSL